MSLRTINYKPKKYLLYLWRILQVHYCKSALKGIPMVIQTTESVAEF